MDRPDLKAETAGSRSPWLREDGMFDLHRGRLDNGITIGWASPALTTAMALEALCVHAQLAS